MMKNLIQVRNVFAIIGIVSTIVIACSAALNDNVIADNAVIAENSTTENTTTDNSTSDNSTSDNSSSENNEANTVGTYQLTISNMSDGEIVVGIINTKTGKYELTKYMNFGNTYIEKLDWRQVILKEKRSTID